MGGATLGMAAQLTPTKKMLDATGNADFYTVKSRVSANLSPQIKILQATQSCISAASSRKAMLTCHQQHQKSMIALRSSSAQ